MDVTEAGPSATTTSVASQSVPAPLGWLGTEEESGDEMDLEDDWITECMDSYD